MVLAFGISGCKNDSDDAFAGTWIMKDPRDGLDKMKIVAADGSLKVYGFEWAQSGSQGGGTSQPQLTATVEQIRGTYTASGNAVNVTITQVNTGYMSWDRNGSRPADSWANYADAPTEIKDEIPPTMQGTISGSQLSINNSIFTKQ